MKTLFGALALVLALPAAAQTSPVAHPHAAHAQHQQQTAPASTHGKMDHAKMMEKCKDPNASAEMKAHCAEMMKHHGQHQAAPAQPQSPHAQHSH